EQLVALRVDRVDLAGELVLHEVVEQRRAERAGAVRRPDHRDRLRPQQPVDLRVGETPLAHACLPECPRPIAEKPSPSRGEGWVGVYYASVDARPAAALPHPSIPSPPGRGGTSVALDLGLVE